MCATVHTCYDWLKRDIYIYFCAYMDTFDSHKQQSTRELDIRWMKAPLAGGLPFFLQNMLVWLSWSCVIDYLSLFKTRLLVRYLKTRASVILLVLVCALDFFVGFVIYVLGFAFLATVSHVIGGKLNSLLSPLRQLRSLCFYR